MLDMKKYKKLSKDLQSGMENMQDELAKVEVEGAAGGGVLRIVANGNQEILKVDAFVRDHTTGRLQGGGGRIVEPKLVFEIAFEGIAASPRHKSGVATRFPRMNRWRTDKKPEEADTLGFVKGLLAQHVKSARGRG